jgi:3-hydroxyisobutyrate dehydrogenase
VGRDVLAAARTRHVDFVDAPVAGQTIRAEAGTLAIYAGGSKKAFGRALHVLETMGDPMQIFHLGPSGSGYAVKLLLNLMWFMHAVATAEALMVGVRAGVDLETLHTALVHSPANSEFLERDVRMVLDRGDYDEGFAMKLVTKDLGLAVELARDSGVSVELLGLVEQIHRRARLVYGDTAGEMSAVRLYEDVAEAPLRLRP